ncbi:DUF2889 domain-containing protein [Luteithermobacter gelatinilyticus]|uniref:DUF2889 domain-containing protein n=1 Tax=Luteithermobacter gelatinilyticus TaxID=2582913 RepID=UPI0011058611|nr:DUF2889 domain-containing protein [Luteithermobacter gelatinilyticus]|tara:strand:+ start:1136 stop:1771 length:636 start_codon:yes stop_codon:yes gene_type:complete
MPLSEPAARKRLHTRTIICDGYEREDGLWDIEGHMTDVKSYPFENRWRGPIQPGDPIHDMSIRMTVDDDLVIRDIEAVTDHSPFEMCPHITAAYKKLVGVRIGPGWRREIKTRVGGVEGCTHLTELFTPLATVAIQTVMTALMKRREQQKKELGKDLADSRKKKRPPVLNTCHAWASDSPVVREHAPDFYTGPDLPKLDLPKSDLSGNKAG